MIILNNRVEELEVITTPTKIKYKGIVWIPETDVKSDLSIQPPSKQNYFVRWLKTKKPADIFMLDDFYKKHPKHRKDANCKRRLSKAISELVDSKVLQQLGKDKFKVLK